MDCCDRRDYSSFTNTSIKSLGGLSYNNSDFVAMRRSNSLKDEYEIGPVIAGTGGLESRLVTFKKTGEKRMMKVIKKTAEVKLTRTMTYIDDQFKLLGRLDHPNIMRIRDILEDSEYIYIMTEYVKEGDLFTFMTRKKVISEPLIKTIVKQIVSALKYMH